MRTSFGLIADIDGLVTHRSSSSMELRASQQLSLSLTLFVRYRALTVDLLTESSIWLRAGSSMLAGHG